MWVDWAVLWFFQKIRTNSNNFCWKSYIGLNIWTKQGKNWPKNCWKLYMLSVIMQKHQKYYKSFHAIKSNENLMNFSSCWYIVWTNLYSKICLNNPDVQKFFVMFIKIFLWSSKYLKLIKHIFLVRYLFIYVTQKIPLHSKSSFCL